MNFYEYQFLETNIDRSHADKMSSTRLPTPPTQPAQSSRVTAPPEVGRDQSSQVASADRGANRGAVHRQDEMSPNTDRSSGASSAEPSKPAAASSGAAAHTPRLSTQTPNVQPPSASQCIEALQNMVDRIDDEVSYDNKLEEIITE